MLNFLNKLIKEAGEICIEQFESLDFNSIEFKNRKDLVTTVDKQVEKFIIKNIKHQYPTHSIIGEETGKDLKSSAYCWIIDPIDGTTSYFHGQPFYAVSIALAKNNETVLGAVYAPVLKELFYAQKGQGAWLNEKSICVSSTKMLVDSVFATGFACLRTNLEPNNLKYFSTIVPHLRDIRRYGSAAIDLCYVACGRLDGFWEMNLNLYDIAAGTLIVHEAHGDVFDFNGQKNYPEKGIIATNPYLKDKVLKFFSTA